MLNRVCFRLNLYFHSFMGESDDPAKSANSTAYVRPS